MFSSKPKPARLEKQLSFDEKITMKKETVQKWAMRHCFGLLMITTIVSLISFVLICLLFVGATESGMYYNHLVAGRV